MIEDKEFFSEASRYTLKQTYASNIATLYNNNTSIKYIKDKNKRYLTYNKEIYDLPDDPKHACKLIVSLLKQLEVEESQIPDNWNKIPKFMKLKMIEDYINSVSDILSKEDQFKLMMSIKVGLFTNFIKTKDISLSDGKINSIDGIDYSNLIVIIKTPTLKYGDIDGIVTYSPKIGKVKYIDSWVC